MQNGLMEREDALEFSGSISQIGEGWFRQVALGVKLRVPESLGLERAEWCNRFKVAMRSPDERRLAAKELKDEGFATAEIADVFGISESRARFDIAKVNLEESAARNKRTLEEEKEEQRQEIARNKRKQMTEAEIKAEERAEKKRQKEQAETRIIQEAKRSSSSIVLHFRNHVNSILDGARLGEPDLTDNAMCNEIAADLKRLRGAYNG